MMGAQKHNTIQRSTGSTFIEPAVSYLREGRCGACGKPKSEWNRRTDWACCSKKCTNKLFTEYYYTWEVFRLAVFERDDFTCAKCGYISRNAGSDLIADHIIPIAIGGEEWDKKNVQTLCESCNKVKTKADQRLIAEYRRFGKHVLKTSQQTL